jgi:uncharacterized membrane protein YcaP (DUF421 family)
MRVGELILRTLIAYLLVLIVLRILGKREINSLSPADLVVSIMMANLATFPLEEYEHPMWVIVVPIVSLAIAEVSFSWLSLKNRQVRRLVNGAPSLLVWRGEVNESELRRLRYSLDDLFTQLRDRGIADLSQVQSAVLEPGGTLSVIPTPDAQPLTRGDLDYRDGSLRLVPTFDPVVVVTDGHLLEEGLKATGLSRDRLADFLGDKFKIERIEDIFIAYRDSRGIWHAQCKGGVSRT